MSSLEYTGNHTPFFSHLICTKLISIPLLGTVCRRAEISHDKSEPTQDGHVERLSRRRCHVRNGKIYGALACIMWADNILEHALTRQRVLFQTGQMSMTLILLDPSSKEHGQRRRNTRRQ